MWQSWLAVLAVVPTALQFVRRAAAKDRWFWLALAAGLAGPIALAATHLVADGRMGFSESLWASAAATMLMFGLACLMLREAWRLAGLLGTYMLIVTLLAALWQTHRSAAALAGQAHAGWMTVHVATALATYGLVTLAAVAAFAAVLQAAALKRRLRSTGFAARLPSLADCDRLQRRFLASGEAVLAAGLISGMALEYLETGRLIALTHKTVFTLAAFVVIALLLAADRLQGVGGRRAARLVLLSYLLLTLGFPGVKFVTDVLLATATAPAGGVG